MSYKIWGVPPPDSNTKVTVELGELIDNGINIWDFDYPTYYNGNEKTAFEQKVVDHYRFRQIGQETPARFMHYFRTRIREIMPYYIQLYKSVELMESIEDPFESYNLREEFTLTRSGTSSSEASDTAQSSGTSSSESETDISKTVNETRTSDETETTSSTGTKKLSNTPQGSITNLDHYLTEATVENGNNSRTGDRDETAINTTTGKDTVNVNETSSSSSSGSSTATVEDSGTETHTLTRKGNIGVQPLGSEVRALRDSFINVDLMIINELNDLFLQIY